MSITSFWYLLLVAAGVLVYYIIPRKVRWIELLILSLVFYYFAASPVTVIYPAAVTVIAYISVFLMDKVRKRGFVLAVSVIIIVLIWFVVKGRGLWYPALDLISDNSISLRSLDSISIIAALGMGYYTLQISGYIIDCYWKVITPQKNPLKLFLFVIFFPQMTTGPVSRYSQLETIYAGQAFSYDNICMGAQRILWGFFKKLVIADRIDIIVSGIMANPDYNGFYSWIMVLIYPLQMYADFSGCMDIVAGTAQLFGITLPENFNNPFFSRTTQEFWQRWHITLGTWAKDYVLYPLLKCAPMVKLGRSAKKKFGKKTGNFVKNSICMFALWMVMGIWHGGYQYIIGVSLWYWVILMLGNLLDPLFKKIINKVHIKTESFSWHLFQSARTYAIYAIGAAFFVHGISGAVIVLKDCFKVIFNPGYANPWIFFDSSILNLGIELRDLNIIVIAIIMLITVAVLREKYGYAREWVKRQNLYLRWIIWIGLFVFVLVYGKYGPGYSAAEFIYQGF